VLASLNHSNIGALFGFEQDNGQHFLVMELIEGQTLDQRIAGKPMVVDDALQIARQIAEALEYAHENGIIHRDLKPSNVKITPDGKVKVLDFGLAKAMAADSAHPNLSQSPTMLSAASHQGAILGTAGYMSPEQAKGLSADARSDVFSFGCVLYEMLTGRQAFSGDTVADVLAGVLAREPDLVLLAANLNPRIKSLLQRCIEKNRKRRWHAIADVRVEIEAILNDPHGSSTQAQPVGQPAWRRAIPIVVAVLLTAALTAFTTWQLRPASRADVTRFTFLLPSDQSFSGFGRQILNLSPDGSHLAYGANNRLYLKADGATTWKLQRSSSFPGREATRVSHRYQQRSHRLDL
jgi:eukaryotic-like serine/threonine-protein kinase